MTRRNTPSLAELGEDALFAVSDLLDDDALDALSARSDIEKVRWRYAHADCDDFALALQVLSGGSWSIVSITGSKGPLHRAAQTPAGRLVDVHGYVDVDEVRQRYRTGKLSLRVVEETDSMIDDDAGLRRVMAVMLHLPEPPFSEPAFQRKVAQWLEAGVHFDASPVRPGARLG
jgi:hypothetical protein